MEQLAFFPHLWLVPLASVILIALAILCRHLSDGDDLSGFMLGTIMFGIVGGIGIVVSIVLLIPFDEKYHHFYRLSGVIHIESNRFDDGTGDITRVLVGYVDGYDDPVLLDDSRLMTYDGQNVDLTCTIAWEPYGLDKTICSIAQVN